MTAVATFETRSVRQRDAGLPIDVRQLAEPLPDVLVELVEAKLVAGHEKLVERAAKAKTAELEAMAAFEHAPTVDREAAVAAARAGKAIPPATLPDREHELEQAKATRAALESAVVASADELLVDALQHLDAAKADIDGRIAEAEQTRAELLEAALAVGDRTGALRAEREWLVGAAQGGRMMRPYAAAGRPDETTVAIRQALELVEAKREQRRLDHERAERAQAGEAELVERQRQMDDRGLRRSPPRVRTTDHGAGGVQVEPVDE